MFYPTDQYSDITLGRLVKEKIKGLEKIYTPIRSYRVECKKTNGNGIDVRASLVVSQKTLIASGREESLEGAVHKVFDVLEQRLFRQPAGQATRSWRYMRHANLKQHSRQAGNR